MKKIWICVLFFAFLFAGCGSSFAADTDENVTDEQMQAEQKSVWGITLETKDVTAQGLTLVCTQSGGEAVGELHTGSWFSIQKCVKGQWVQVEYTEVDEEQVGWTSEAWLILPENTVEWEVDWSWLYDKLPNGEYRIVKEITNFRGTGDYDEAEIYAAFTIE